MVVNGPEGASRGASADAIPTPILVQSERRPQIYSANFVVSRQALWRAAPEDRSIVNDVRAVSDAQRFAHVVVGNQDTDATIAQMKDDLLDIGDRDRIDAGERLVEQHE